VQSPHVVVNHGGANAPALINHKLTRIKDTNA
jgi:hypothetical protein